MNIQKIHDILNITIIDDKTKMELILDEIARDENAIPYILKILSTERARKKELLIDMNLELSRAHIYIEMHHESQKESKEHANKFFVMDQIAKFYIKYKGIVTHCFNRFV